MKRLLLICVIALAGVLSLSAQACDDYGCDSWGGLVATGGSEFYNFGVDLYGLSSFGGYDSSYGGDCGSLLSTCGGGYDFANFGGSEWGLGGSSSSFSLGLDIDINIFPIDLGGSYNYGSDCDIGCSIGLCQGGGSMPFYTGGDYLPGSPYYTPGWPGMYPTEPIPGLGPIGYLPGNPYGQPPYGYPNSPIDGPIFGGPIGGPGYNSPITPPPSPYIPWNGYDGNVIGAPNIGPIGRIDYVPTGNPRDPRRVPRDPSNPYGGGNTPYTHGGIFDPGYTGGGMFPGGGFIPGAGGGNSPYLPGSVGGNSPYLPGGVVGGIPSINTNPIGVPRPNNRVPRDPSNPFTPNSVGTIGGAGGNSPYLAPASGGGFIPSSNGTVNGSVPYIGGAGSPSGGGQNTTLVPVPRTPTVVPRG